MSFAALFTPPPESRLERGQSHRSCFHTSQKPSHLDSKMEPSLKYKTESLMNKYYELFSYHPHNVVLINHLKPPPDTGSIVTQLTEWVQA